MLLTATIGIGAYLSLYELRQPPTEERERRSKQVVDIPAEAITQIALDLPRAKLTLTRREHGWTLSPTGFRADESLVQRILGDLAPLIGVAWRRLTG